jgi:antitoxin component YwqK of YwqJK toxin-antitoxin module
MGQFYSRSPKSFLRLDFGSFTGHFLYTSVVRNYSKKEMSKLTKIIFGTLLLTCCSTRERSEIEVVKYDEDLISQIQSSYDSTYVETPKRQDFWTIENYLSDSAKTAMILKDSIGNVVGIVLRENGINTFAQEYYPNGQAMGKEINEHSTYYYEDGRIRSTGKRVDNKQVGAWKDYDKDGYLILTQYYDNDGKLEREEKFE